MKIMALMKGILYSPSHTNAPEFFTDSHPHGKLEGSHTWPLSCTILPVDVDGGCYLYIVVPVFSILLHFLHSVSIRTISSPLLSLDGDYEVVVCSRDCGSRPL